MTDIIIKSKTFIQCGGKIAQRTSSYLEIQQENGMS